MCWGYPEYVPVAQRREQAQKKLAKLKKKGQNIFPVEITGRKIGTTFWGKAWCNHIESFSDAASRLPRGRTYVRNGSVCHLEIFEGSIKAIVSGSELYNITITIKPLSASKWQAISNSCRDQISSILDLLSGRLSDGVMGIVCDKNKGLFPLPNEIELDCSCPDWARMCKHVAAVLYGVGVRLDTCPADLFRLRNVDYNELINVSQAVAEIISTKNGKNKRLSTEDVSKIFGF